MNIVYIGTGEIGAPALKALAASPDHYISAVITQPDKPVGRHQILKASPIKEVAMSLHLRVFQPVKLRQESALEQLRYLNPDLMVVAAYGQILSREALDIPMQGCINIHASLLPKYRGPAPIQEAIRRGDKKSGVSIMWMDEGVDTGDILYQAATPIRHDDNAQTLHDRLGQIGAKALMRSIGMIEAGKAPREKQNEDEASHTSKLSKADGVIDWTRTAEEIDCHVRAMTPWPSAYTFVGEGDSRKMLKVFKCLVAKQANGKPGEVISADRHGILVAAGGGGILIREVQLEGKKRLPVSEYIQGSDIEPGDTVG